jgi:hypothetical protein
MGWLTLALASAGAAENTIKVLEKEPPKDLSDAIRQKLQPRPIEIRNGDKVVYEFWFVSKLPLKAKPESPAKALDAVDEITFMGVARVGEGRRDYKDNEITPGLYTIRFGLQPQDGDHLGTSEFPYFAVLVPIQSDADLALKTRKATLKASGKATATGHPAVLSLRPVASDVGQTPVQIKPAPGLEAIQLQVPAKASDSDQETPVGFELVYQGKYKS